MCPFAVTRTTCTHCTACSCLRASGTEWDYIVSYSLCCTLVWCVRGLSCSTVSWAHLGNVTGVKSGEPGAYYVTLFLQFGNRRLLARPGLCRTVRRGHNNHATPKLRMTHKELHSALLYVILLCNHYTSLHPALCWLHQGPVSLEFARRSPPQFDSSPALLPPLVSCREAPWTTALRPWSSNIRRARSNGRILQLGRLNISRPSTALSSNRFALLD